jgi:DNA-directed RNA polymerase subunit beta'
MTSANLAQLGEPVGIIAAQSIGEAGTQLTMRTFHTGGTATGEDITRGLARVTQLFEAREPKHPASIARSDGIVTEITAGDSAWCVNIRDTVTGKEEKYYVTMGKELLVKQGDLVTRGGPLTQGSFDPHDIFKVCGLQELQEYLLGEVQKVYVQQKVTINCKHIEIILRQMLTKVRITEPGDTRFDSGNEMDKQEFAAENQRVSEAGRRPATCEPLLLGITKAALQSDSFLSAASFQSTSKILAEAAAFSKLDKLNTLKGSVMAGKLVPAGTGFKIHQVR